jgi:hypothetical protein
VHHVLEPPAQFDGADMARAEKHDKAGRRDRGAEPLGETSPRSVGVE